MNDRNESAGAASSGAGAPTPGGEAPVHGAEAPSNVARGIGVAVAGWLVPGLGHLLMRRWRKALGYFLCVGVLAFAGVAMHGLVFGSSATDILDRLGFLADLGTGVFYLASRASSAGADLAHASGDYGTRLIATAGILNVLTVLEAYEIGAGRRN